ncbi:MAG: peptidylprolyl isomerase [Candidatus Cloacimonetes bacterium HGW-Cloacimonetes-2]|jgi:peptidyl-prolyl cis-trans isomerase SurA|nr:MAG: peptidylprolyl isomerase [Candidatus Cloacimonetes bacterium HGW-Cloacimonetes-2]
MKKLALIIIVIISITLLKAELLDKIIAKVGTDIILQSDLEKQILQMRSAGVDISTVEPINVLRDMVEEKLLIQKAQELNLQVDAARIRSYAERYLQQTKAGYPSEAAFNADLARMQVTQQELLDYYIEQITNNALTEMLIERYISSKVRVEDDELRSFYEASKDTLAVKPVTWKVGMIMREIAASDDSDNQQLTAMREIKARLDNGEDFAAVATATSECPSAARGGDLGFFGRGVMVQPFEQAAFSLGVGQISDIIRTQYGYHIIKVEEIRGDEIRARHILKLVSPTAADSGAARRMMEMARMQYVNGSKTFAELAELYSQEEESKALGGVIGEFSAEELPELFANTIMLQPVGQISEVLENEGMLYLFARLEEVPQRLFEFEEVRQQVYDYLFNQKQIEAYGVWIEQLMNEAYVQITP